MSAQVDVAILLDHFGSGGVERVACHLANGLHRRGMAVEMVVLRDGGPIRHLLDPGVSVHVLRTLPGLGRSARLWACAPDLARYLRTRRPKLFHSPGNHTHRAAGLGVRLARYAGVFVPKITNPIVRKASKPLKRALRRAVYGFAILPATRVIVLSEDAVPQAGAIDPRIGDRTVFLPNPYICEEMVPRAPLAPVPGAVPVVLAMGRLSPQKDHATLLRAIALLVDRPWHLRICGAGPCDAMLRELAAELGIADRVEFAGFVVDAAAHYAQATVAVLSSRWEDLPAALVEAIARECPVVSTASSPAVCKLLESGGGLPPVPVNDPPALAAAIARALDGTLPPIDRAAVMPYSLDASCDAHAALFRELIAAHSR